MVKKEYMVKRVELSAEQQAIISELNARLPEIYKTSGHDECQRIAGEAAIKVIELMPTGVMFTIPDVEQPMKSASHAIRSYLRRMAWKDQGKERWLMEDASRYSWEEGNEGE